MSSVPDIDRTAKLYIGGKQSRPDGGYSWTVTASDGTAMGEAGIGNRKDIRNAVEAAAKAKSWSGQAGHNRAQVLYYMAENLSARASEFSDRLRSAGHSKEAAQSEVETSLRRMFYYAAWADKFDGRVHATRSRHLTVALHEPFGVMGLVCPDEAPLLGMVSMVLPAIAMGNRVVVVPSAIQPLSATDFYQILDTSDVPGGVVNIVTGARSEVSKTLADHDEVDALWYAAPRLEWETIEAASAGNLKPVWTFEGDRTDWSSTVTAQGARFLRRATQIKTIWVPYGE